MALVLSVGIVIFSKMLKILFFFGKIVTSLCNIVTMSLQKFRFGLKSFIYELIFRSSAAHFRFRKILKFRFSLLVSDGRLEGLLTVRFTHSELGSLLTIRFTQISVLKALPSLPNIGRKEIRYGATKSNLAKADHDRR